MNLKNKFIFDGYPRNLPQANNLRDLLKKYNQKIDVSFKTYQCHLESIKKRIIR